jgi:hypothetical protein
MISNSNQKQVELDLNPRLDAFSAVQTGNGNGSTRGEFDLATNQLEKCWLNRLSPLIVNGPGIPTRVTANHVQALVVPPKELAAVLETGRIVIEIDWVPAQEATGMVLADHPHRVPGFGLEVATSQKTANVSPGIDSMTLGAMWTPANAEGP